MITLENSLGFSHKTKHAATAQPCSCSPGHLYKRNEILCSHKNMHTNVHSCFNHNQKLKKSRYPSASERLKMWYIPTTECYSTIKKIQLLIHATTSM